MTLLWLLLLSCTGPPVPPALEDSAEPDSGAPRAPSPDTGEMTDADCSPTFSSDRYLVFPRDNLRLEVAGGSGIYRFSMVEAPSGGLVSPGTGDYLAGDITGVIDVVAAEDEICGMRAEAEIEVRPVIVPVPSIASVPPGTLIPFTAEGGSGEVSCALLSSGSGAELSGCDYTAGPNRGTDRLRLGDLQTGDTSDVEIVVSPDVVLSGTPLWGLIQGDAGALDVSGGTELYDIIVESGDVSVSEGRFTLNSLSGRLRVTDRFAPSMAMTVELHAIVGRSPEDVTIDGGDPEEGTVLSLGDIDGDLISDVVVINPESSVAAWEGGACYLFTSTMAAEDDALGLAQVIGHSTSESGFGYSAAAGEFTGDGVIDLAVGAPQDSGDATGSGTMTIYAGDGKGGLVEEPYAVFSGTTEGDALGFGATSCDYNGDGWDDLVAGAPYAEETFYNTGLDDHGQLALFTGGKSGLTEEAADVWGAVPDGDGGWSFPKNLNAGRRLSSGDIDGDGYCDLVVGIDSHSTFTEGGDDADVVLVYRGDPDTGLSALPSAAWVFTWPEGSNLGRGMAVGDIDGDGMAEIAVGGGSHDSDYSNQGIVFIIAGQSLPSEAAAVEELSPSWQIRGSSSSDDFGEELAIADLDGDGLGDLVLGEPLGGTVRSGSGAVRIYPGALLLSDWDVGHDATADKVPYHYGPDESSVEFGRALAIMADMDGSGKAGLATLAAEDNTIGPDVGALYVLPWDFDGEAEVHGLPVQPSGQHIGSRGSMSMVDVDGDGSDELVVGGWGEAFNDNRDIGAVWVYGIGMDGVLDAHPRQTLGLHSQGRTRDGYGAGVLPAGDVDGDGYQDVAVMANMDDRPSSAPSGYVTDGDCLESVNNTGSVQVHRGGPDGLDEEPSWIAYGSCAYTALYDFAAGLDQDGDGMLELAYGAPRCTSSSGLMVRGIELNSTTVGSTTVACDAEPQFHEDSSDRLGEHLAPLGDIDGDGCDELAVSVKRDDIGSTNQGTVRVLWGAGGQGCPDSPMQTVLTRQDADELPGSIRGGTDIDGDGLPDLVIGEPDYVGSDGEAPGAVWLVPSSTLASLERYPAGTILGDDAERVYDLSDIAIGVQGLADGDELGASLALSDGQLIAGAPMAYGGRGAALVYGYDSTAGDLRTEAVLLGPSDPGSSRFGSGLAAGSVGLVPVLAVGASMDDGAGVDNGKVYSWLLSGGL